MKVTRTVPVLDAADLVAVSSFWAAIYEGAVEDHGEWHSVVVDGQAVLDVQLAPDHRPPQWPDGEPQQVHLDLYVDDIQAAHAQVVGLGAPVLQTADLHADRGFQTYADPAGHPFCLCWG
jgi:hypothetical protein